MRFHPHISAIWLLIAVLLAFSLNAQTLNSGFESANQLYEKGDYAAAASAYENLLSDKHASPSIYFNLGNAWFKQDQIGRAILNYHRALRLAPRDPDVRANLEFARDKVSGASAGGRSFWTRWLSRVRINEVTAVAAVLLWLCFAALISAQLRPALKQKLQPFVRPLIFLAILSLLLVTVMARIQLAQSPGVIITREAVARYGPLEESQSSFTLRDGAEVQITDWKNGWVQIRDSAGRLGWIKEDQLARW